MITVRFEIDRHAAILAGLAYQGFHELQLNEADIGTLTREERELLACVPSTGATWPTWHGHTALFRPLAPNKGTFIEALRKKLAELQAREAHEQEAKLQANADRLAREEKDAARVKRGVEHVKSLSVEECLAGFRHVSGYGGAVFELKALRDPTGDIFTLPEIELQPELGAMRALKDSREAEAKAKKVAIEEKRRDLLKRVIREYGTPLQLARWNEGLCPESEAIDLQREAIFRPFGDLPRYRKIENGEVEHADTCSCPNIDTYVGPADALTDAEYTRLVALRSRLPEGFTLTVREHRVWCAASDCEDSPVVSRNGALVETTWNGVSFSREFGLDIE